MLFVVIATIFLTRSFVEPILEATKITIGGSHIGFGAVINAVLISVAFLSILTNYKNLSLRDLVAWIAFLTFCAIASIETSNPVSVGRIILGYLSYLSAFVIPLCLVRSIRDVDRITDVILLSSLIPAFIGIFEIASNLGDGDFRLKSTFNHPNIFAFYIVAVMATILFKWSSRLFSPSRLRRLFYIALYGVLGGLLLFTQTRSAWFGAALLLTAFALFLDRRAILLLFIAGAVALLTPTIRDRLLDVGKETEYIGTGVIMNSFTWRKALWSNAFAWVEERPFLGHGGLGTFNERSIDFFPFGWGRTDAHSVYVKLLFEVGIFGPILFGAIFLQILWPLFRLAWADWSGSIIGGVFALSYLAFSYSDNMLGYLSSNWYAFLFLGTLVSIERNLSSRVALSTGADVSARYISPDMCRSAQRLRWSLGRDRSAKSTSPFCRIKPTMTRASRQRNRLASP